MRNGFVFFMMMLVSIPAMPGTELGSSEGSHASRQSQKEMQRQASFRDKVEFFGTGTEILVMLRNASVARKGKIEEISADSFNLNTGDHRLRIEYNRIEELNLSRIKYKAAGQPDPIEVRRVAYEIGIGNKAKVELADGRRFRGAIEAFEDGVVVLRAQNNRQPVNFSDVKAIERSRMPWWGKALVAVGTIVGIVLIITGIGVAATT